MPRTLPRTERQPLDRYEQRASEAPPEISIPIDDPEAALMFCRRLAGLVDETLFTPTDTIAKPLGGEPPPPELSVVMPVFNEEDNLPSLHQRLTTVLRQTGLSYEIVFVDDGSRDESLSLLRALAADDLHVLVVELARNFGHQVAISAGLDHSSGAAVIVMDADLQDPPEVLPQFIDKWREGHD
ncbi:MAG: glycosyltransferase family 2 protein, partial [Chloroflexota bacterium]|nr:glycosyltransferase family 2 protein [Chloroflexota bacterium]